MVSAVVSAVVTGLLFRMVNAGARAHPHAAARR